MNGTLTTVEGKAMSHGKAQHPIPVLDPVAITLLTAPKPVKRERWFRRQLSGWSVAQWTVPKFASRPFPSGAMYLR